MARASTSRCRAATMGNWKLTRSQEPQALTRAGPARDAPRPGRRAVAPPAHPPLHRRGRGPLAAGGRRRARSGFLWPNLSSGFGGQITLGNIEHGRRQPGGPGAHAARTGRRPTSRRRAPTSSSSTPASASRTATRPTARARPRTCARCSSAARTSAASPTSATSTTGSSAPATARAMTAWAPRSRSSARRRAASTASPTSSQDGVLIVDTSKITLGPLPVALGQPGLIPARSPAGCI